MKIVIGIYLIFFLVVPPNVTVTSSAQGPVVEGRDSVSLTCDVDSNPESELAWRKEGTRRVLGNFPVLDIGVVSRTDMGTYTCKATNQLGVSAPASVVVETYCKYTQNLQFLMRQTYLIQG